MFSECKKQQIPLTRCKQLSLSFPTTHKIQWQAALLDFGGKLVKIYIFSLKEMKKNTFWKAFCAMISVCKVLFRYN